MPSNPIDPNPEIEGLHKVKDAYGHLVNYGASTGDSYDDEGGTFQCWGGIPHDLFPIIDCAGPGPSGASFSLPFSTTGYPPGTIPPLDLYPQPDFAIVEVTFGLDFFPYPDGCKSGGSPDAGVSSDGESGFGCSTNYLGTTEAAVAARLTTGAGIGTANFEPWAGWDAGGWNPGRDPSYDTTSGAFWNQGGPALVAAPATVYADPDPLDPNIDYVPYLWRWADILDQVASIDVTGTVWHRIRTGSTSAHAMTLTVYPYRLATPATSSQWMHVL